MLATLLQRFFLIGVVSLAISCGSSNNEPGGITSGTDTTSSDGNSDGNSDAIDSGTTSAGNSTGSDSNGTSDSTTAGGTDGTTSSGTSTGATGTDSGFGSAEPLAPLPDPPLTQSPDQSNEPEPVVGAVSTITSYFLVRDPSGTVPEDTFGEITDTDFAQGPLPPVIFTPDHVDPTTNAAPYFDALEDQQLFAGETLQLLLRPLDPDGGIPGMFPESIPEGASYIDNFNGTRTLIWQPLQPDVGILEFTITAVDPVEPLYRTQRTVRIKVDLPADQSGIPNIAPTVNAVRTHTVRVGDPVVVELKGEDRNGTIPSLSVTNTPSGSTFEPHYNEEKISVLRFIPETTETITLNVVATDAVNPALTGTGTVTLEVLPRSSFERAGLRLRNIAGSRDLRIGFASLQEYYYRPDGALYSEIAEDEFNMVTTENTLKWDYLNPVPGYWRWAATDNLVTFGNQFNMLIHGHTLVWHRSLPGWVQRTELLEREMHMREFIDRVLNRYADDVEVWDVVNEPFEDDGSFRNSVWYEAMGSDYIDIAFRQARESAPNATLLLNEYDISWQGPKRDALMNLLDTLETLGTPLDGIGFQMHVFAAFDQFDEVEETFNLIAEKGLDVYITELDVSMVDDNTEEQQADVYGRIVDICIAQARCKAIQTWGFTDQYSWRRDFTPLLLDAAYQPKPAYSRVQERLAQ
ncbi:MAG: endo-1,4-beta-xylanase [Gammaproteobacteria bacterium]|nr:endo-1,4-beta-xylanase [Gammaproteobacteria bacterium]